MYFFDTHTHFDVLLDEQRITFNSALDNARAADVQRILIACIDVGQFSQVSALCAQAPKHLCYGVGLHPLFITHHRTQDLDTLAAHLQTRPHFCVAVAEIGLERAVAKLITPENWAKQCQFLEAQLFLAQEHQLAVSLHSRRSHDQLYTFLKRIDLPKKGVIHGFAGSYVQAKRFVDLGYAIGVGGTITYPRANKTREAIRQLPLDALVLETDSPDMPVNGYQGQPNEPARIAQVFEALCQLRQESADDIKSAVWARSIALFSPPQ
ncbi:TatD family deoxyribonuclease [Pasteurellaceae bacterium HPA106]|uniref:TatD family hydrolase n=1 Tax=Spirabiliibacterium pneumoniae TaxID=221400 RepID=UPI001AAE071A|nr:TatD family hydrolase [Spirabiliibacterium pneumoniae]MBE2896954.1 TatD family deoxyribonuclease [Spirabiliibacterium pneumoniae]